MSELKIKSKKEGKTKIKLSVEVPVKVVNEFKKEALDKLAKELDIKGFRKGKVPPKEAKKHLEEEKIDQEALRIAVPQVYVKAIKDKGLEPVAQPEVDVKQFEKDKPLKLEYELETVPEIKLPDYKKLNVKKAKPELSDEEVKEGLEGLQKRMADYKDKKGKAKKGDWVEVNFEGKIKGAKIDELSSKNHPFVLGQGGFVKGFEDEVIGMKKDEEKTFKIKLPDDHPAEQYAGKEVKFEVKINKVKEIELADLDEVAKKLNAKNKKELEEKFKKAQQEQKKQEVDKKYEQKLVAKLVEEAEFEIPEGLIDQEYQRLSSSQEEQLSQQGMTKEKYFKEYNIDEKDYEKQLKQSARQNVEVALVMNKLAQEEEIEPGKGDLKKKTEELISTGMQQGGDKNKLRDHYESDQGQNFVENIVRNEKTLEKLKELNS